MGVVWSQECLANFVNDMNALESVGGVRRAKTFSLKESHVSAFLISILCERMDLALPSDVWMCLHPAFIRAASEVIFSATNNSSNNFTHSFGRMPDQLHPLYAFNNGICLAPNKIAFMTEGVVVSAGGEDGEDALP